MNRLGISLRGLRWKLTASYTAVTVGALLVLILVAAFLIFSLVLTPDESFTPTFWVATLEEKLVPVVAYLLSEEPADLNTFELLLQSTHPTLSDRDLLQIGDTQVFIRTTGQVDILITDSEGVLVGATPNILRTGIAVGHRLDASRIPGLEEPLRAALAGEQRPTYLASTGGPEYELIVAVPVFSFREDRTNVLQHQVVGAIALVFESLPTESDIPAHTLRLLSRSFLIFLFAAGILGTLFGFLTAHGLSGRFERLSAAADAWSQGDFSALVEDRSGDELAGLAEHLNRMAVQLQKLLEERQEVAVFEERSRLARDLHDAVTQTLFSASLIAETLPEIWESDRQEGQELLGELRRLSRGALAEMRTLLLELRPAALVEANLGDLLRQLAEAVTGRTGIPVLVKVEKEGGECLIIQVPILPPDVHVALYRIAQEALNNVVKHAHADEVTVHLCCATSSADIDKAPRKRVELQVRDNGRGFDPSCIPPDRLGLGIIRERAQAIGAELTIESQPGRGTQLVVVWKEEP
jgi:two-component system, NarL family, sensor histidine kinase LiaS